jgi:hypothetical protein
VSKRIKQLFRRFVSDRRRAPRYQSTLNVHLAAVAVGRGVRTEPIPGRTRDISETGILMSLQSSSYYQRESIRVGAAFRILLALPNGTIDLTATIVRTEPLDQQDVDKGQLVAIEITSMDPKDQAAYKEYLKFLG